MIIDVQDNNVYVTFDDTAPTATNGHILVKDNPLITLSANAGKAAKFLGISGTAIVHVSEIHFGRDRIYNSYIYTRNISSAIPYSIWMHHYLYGVVDN